MVKLKNLFSIILLSIILYGCCSTSTITVTEIDTFSVRDTVQLIGDTIWYGGITNGADTIGSLAVHPKSKKAEINIKWLKPDTLYVPIEDTKYLVITQTLEKVLTALLVAMPFYQKLIVLILIIAGFYIVYKLWKKK
ncbi:MAG: hypothetical protein RBR74_09055 [Ignavibacteriaceae bacterium]|nr:hypothetical protein [Ignavibacteriaceae bacterium]